MEYERFKPLVDKLYFIISIPTLVLIATLTAAVCVFPVPAAVITVILVDITVAYLLVSPLFGYVELREDSVYIKYGLLLKKEIPYERIREAVKERKLYSDSMISLKNAFEHVNIKYNTFDVVTVSVATNDAFIKSIDKRISNT